MGKITTTIVMAPLSSAHAPALTGINLTRLLARLQQTLISPDPATESRLRTSLEREKVGTNIEYARTLLVRLEQDAQTIKVQSRKHELQADLVQKREMLQRLSERLDEMNEVSYIWILPFCQLSAKFLMQTSLVISSLERTTHPKGKIS